METHLHGGMGMLLLDGIDVWPEVPEEYRWLYLSVYLNSEAFGSGL